MILEAFLFGEEANLIFKEFKSKSSKCFSGRLVLFMLLELLLLEDDFQKEFTF